MSLIETKLISASILLLSCIVHFQFHGKKIFFRSADIYLTDGRLLRLFTGKFHSLFSCKLLFFFSSLARIHWTKLSNKHTSLFNHIPSVRSVKIQESSIFCSFFLFILFYHRRLRRRRRRFENEQWIEWFQENSMRVTCVHIYICDHSQSRNSIVMQSNHTYWGSLITNYKNNNENEEKKKEKKSTHRQSFQLLIAIFNVRCNILFIECARCLLYVRLSNFFSSSLF